MQQYTEFFANLAHRIDTTRRQEQDLDRRLAHRFNVFDCLEIGELGLSKIIAELFDPTRLHGQGAFFLERFISMLRNSADLGSRFCLGNPNISVKAEAQITDHQRIDVLVRFDFAEESHALAIENKPFANDREDQIRNYLNYLDKWFGCNFLLVYLSPRGEPPSTASITPYELKNKWASRFSILSYSLPKGKQQQDEYTQYRIAQFSFADWVRNCRRDCEVDRLRWVLGDLADFCQLKFGE